MPLSDGEIRMYQRQLILDDIGISGQEKLKNVKLGVIGAGGLGCPLLLSLTNAGMGTINIFDFDTIAEHNLHRQVLFTHNDIGKYKCEVAALVLKKHNPYINIIPHNIKIDTHNAVELLSAFDIIIDGSDNFETRYAVGDTCAQINKPLISGAIYKFEGQVAVFNYKNSICYRDLFPKQPDNNHYSCEIAGVTGTTCAVIAGIMANELLKIVLEKENVLAGKVLQIDLLNLSFNTFNIQVQNQNT